MLTDNDILIIQKKVDGTLTANEEELFRELTASNPHAEDLYKELLCVQQNLLDNAAGIPSVDLTDDVMAAIRRKSKTHNVFLAGWRRYYAYAALVVLVFTLGVLAANYLIPPAGTWQQEDIAGTMTGKHPSSFADREEGVEIEMEEYRKDELLVYTLFVTSRDSLEVEFIQGQDNAEILYFRRIWPGDKPELPAKQDHSMHPVCGENVIFTVTNPPVDSEIIFTKKGKQIHKIRF